MTNTTIEKTKQPTATIEINQITLFCIQKFFVHIYSLCYARTCEKNTIHQVTTMLATSKNILFPDHNHLLTTGTDDLTLSLSPECHDILRSGLHGGYLVDSGFLHSFDWAFKFAGILMSGRIIILTLKVLNFWTFIETWSGWIFDSYWSLKTLCSGMGEVVLARTSPTLPPPSPRTVL